MRVVIESPLKGKTPEEQRENYRYALWCMRAVYLAGHEPIASHTICTWFMNDADERERNDGIAWSWMWQGDPHWFFSDRGFSSGMLAGIKRCEHERIKAFVVWLFDYDECWAAFQRGEWPPHTAGFSVGAADA